jgi:hypothetical protein
MSLVREVLRIKRADGFDTHAGKTPLQRRQAPLDRVVVMHQDASPATCIFSIWRCIAVAGE